MIKSKLYCKDSCEGSYSEITIEENVCYKFSPKETCNYNVPFFTAIPNPNSPQNYTVITSFKCDQSTTIQDQKKNVVINQCTTFEAYGVTFSLFPGDPYEASDEDNTNTSNQFTINSILNYSILISILILILINYII